MSNIELTKSQLAKFNGTQGKFILIAYRNQIYDATPHRHIYEPGGIFHEVAATDVTDFFTQMLAHGSLSTREYVGMELLYINIIYKKLGHLLENEAEDVKEEALPEFLAEDLRNGRRTTILMQHK